MSQQTDQQPSTVKYKKLPLDENGELINRPPLLVSPRSLVMFSFPKSGKTVAMKNVKNILIGDAEGGTISFDINNVADLMTHDQYVTIDKKRVKTDTVLFKQDNIFVPSALYETVLELTKANKMKAFNAANEDWLKTRNKKSYDKAKALLQEMPFPIFAIDTLSGFKELVYQCALAVYKNKFPAQKKATDIKLVDNYGGAQYIRRAVEQIKMFIEKYAAPFVIYTGHVKMKKVTVEKEQDELSVPDLDLEGTLGTIFTASAQAVCTLERDDEGVWMNFKKKVDTDMDARCEHLSNRRIKISELHEYNDDGDIVKMGQRYWSKIYPELSFNE